MPRADGVPPRLVPPSRTDPHQYAPMRFPASGSIAQAYALLRSVWSNERMLFEPTWARKSATLTNAAAPPARADTDAARCADLLPDVWHGSPP